MCATGKEIPSKGVQWCIDHRCYSLLALEVKKGHTLNDDYQLILVERFIARDAVAADILMKLDARLGEDGLCERARKRIIEYSHVDFVEYILLQNIVNLSPETVTGLIRYFCEGHFEIIDLLKTIFKYWPHSSVDAMEILISKAYDYMKQKDVDKGLRIIKLIWYFDEIEKMPRSLKDTPTIKGMLALKKGIEQMIQQGVDDLLKKLK